MDYGSSDKDYNFIVTFLKEAFFKQVKFNAYIYKSSNYELMAQWVDQIYLPQTIHNTSVTERPRSSMIPFSAGDEYPTCMIINTQNLYIHQMRIEKSPN